MKIENIDHIVLTVKNSQRSCEFYQQVLGMKLIIFNENRKALVFGKQKINIHEVGNEFKPHAKAPTPGSQDLCFITKIPLDQVIQHLEECGIHLIDGPVERTGALGKMTSIYFRDPDLNLIEVATYNG